MADSAQLVQVAESLVDSGNPRVLYAACWVVRRALEGLVDDFVAIITSEAQHASTRSKLAILVAMLPGTPVPHHARVAWDQLSHACHLRAYELTPTAAEVKSWLAHVRALSDLYALAQT